MHELIAAVRVARLAVVCLSPDLVCCPVPRLVFSYRLSSARELACLRATLEGLNCLRIIWFVQSINISLFVYVSAYRLVLSPRLARPHEVDVFLCNRRHVCVVAVVVVILHLNLVVRRALIDKSAVLVSSYSLCRHAMSVRIGPVQLLGALANVPVANQALLAKCRCFYFLLTPAPLRLLLKLRRYVE